MSYADRVFIDMCRDILENGTSTEGRRYDPTGLMVRLPIPSRSSVW